MMLAIALIVPVVPVVKCVEEELKLWRASGESVKPAPSVLTPLSAHPVDPARDAISFDSNNRIVP